MVKKPVREHTDANMTTRVLVRDIMNSPVISASPDDNIYEIAKKMKDANIGSIIIMENEKPVGIVTDWDIVSKAMVNDIKPSQIKAKDVMKDLYTIESEESITEAARQLRKHNIKRLGVVYKNRLVGIISSSDVIAVTPDLVEIVSEKVSLIRGELGIARSASNVSGFCDQCGEWSDLLQYVDDTFICEVCRGESSGGAEGA
ncbi:MAG: CBS domain-containing protein [Thermoproteota archaeon]|nr:CBS domain-containing protein [Thermoproteota archaeon]